MTASSTILGAGTREREDQGASSETTGLSPTVEPLRVSPASAASIPSRGPMDAAREAFERHYRRGFTLTRADWGDGYLHDGIDAMWKGWFACWRERDHAAPAFAAPIPSGGWRPISEAPKDGTWVWAEWPEIKQATKTKSKAPRIVAPAFYGRPDPQDHYMPHWCMNGRWTPGDGPARWFPMGQPPASCDEHPKGEDAIAAESRSDASAVRRKSETPQVSVSSPPNPPPTLTAEEARDWLDGIRDPVRLAKNLRLDGREADAQRVETALRLLADQDNSEGRDA